MGNSSEKKILHICNWYPNRFDPIEGQFIKDQIDALNRYIPCEVVLLQVRFGKLKFVSYEPSVRERIWIIQVPVKWWFVTEIISSLMLWVFLVFRFRTAKYRLVNFHIAYPLLTYFHLLKKRITVPVVITEHWSAYHFNFGVSKELKKIKRIFANYLPVITVSGSLAADVQRFSGHQFPAFQLPNVVNGNYFRMRQTPASKGAEFFMLGCWQFPKIPGLILECLAQLKREQLQFRMRIGGYGPYEEELRSKIASLGLADQVGFIGKLTFEQAASEMQKASFFVHASQYETFSLVCAEALSCGTPVIASAVGGIPEYLHEDNGILVSENNSKYWCDALRASYITPFNRNVIAKEANEKFSVLKIGAQYRNILEEIMGS